jgi:hypothetical protein
LASPITDYLGRYVYLENGRATDDLRLYRDAMTRKIAIACVFLLATISSSLAADADSLLQRMPSTFSGTHVWQHNDETWHATVTFTSRYAGQNGDAIFEGLEDIRSPDGATSFRTKVRAVVNAQSLAFDMAEIYDYSKPGFSPSVYIGNMSPDLNSIYARWRSSGKNLVVHLTAR